jgi:ADP-heptose:LPS heptosyltransferase
VKTVLRRIALDWLGRRRENAMWRLHVKRIDVRQCDTMVLLSLDGKLGDAIIQSSLVRAVSAANPRCAITVLTTERLGEYWGGCDGVASVRTVSSRSDAPVVRRVRELLRLAGIPALGGVDLLISLDPIPMIDYFAFVRRARPRAAIGLSATQYSIFDVSVADPIFEAPKQHAGERIVRTLAAIGLPVHLDSLRSLVPRDVRTTRSAAGTGEARPVERLFLNGFGASVNRTFSARQLTDVARAFLVKYPRLQVVLNVDQAQRNSAEMRQLCVEYPAQVTLLAPDATVLLLFQAIADADAVLTPDTGVSHVAASTSTPLVVVFDDVEFNPVCWRPLTVKAVCLVPDHPGPITHWSASDLIQALERAFAA